jgi:glycosyltransferase involved in cell wall biosynthesis
MAVYTEELLHQRKLMSAVDCATLAYRSRLAQAHGTVGTLRAGLALQTVRAFERKIYRDYDACTVVADRDAAVIRSLCPELPVHVVPNGIDCEAFHPTPPAEVEPGLLLFTGTMDYGPNVDAIVWFVREILPLIRASEPSVHLDVVGRNPTEAVQALAATPGVRITGFVPSVQPHLSHAAVFVCPLREGAGMKNKMLEAMAAGKAIVTTSEGCSGIGGVDGLEYMIADDARRFAEAVIELLKAPERCRALGQSARSFVEANYSWERTGRLMHELYLSVAGREAASAEC